MKKKIFLVLIIICFLLLTCFIYIYSKDNLRFKFEYELYNNIDYNNGKNIVSEIPTDNKIIYVKEKNLKHILTSGDAVVYFGYSTCPWCRNIVSSLLNIVNDSNIDKLYYVDVKSVDVKKALDILDKYLEQDEDGDKHLYVPDVYFIKDGKIVFHHLGVVDSYKNAFSKMNDEQKKELRNIYQKGIDLILGKEENVWKN